ncbi:MAG: hypothetical protein O9264_03725 [Leptospira sp.]|nr:hypothetical protein [Leptospira sp.]
MFLSFQKLFVFSLFLILIHCSNVNEQLSPTISVQGVQVQESFPIKEISIRGRVIRETKNQYSLAFESKYLQQILFYKPSKIQVKLPYINTPTFLVNLVYYQDQIKSSFQFPEGYIDSAELEGYFYINNTQGWQIPFDAIYSPFGDNQYVFKYQSGKAFSLPINVIRVYQNHALILGNLEKGDIIIKTRQGDLVEGMQVKVEL